MNLFSGELVIENDHLFFEKEQIKLLLSKEWKNMVQEQANKTVVLGIHPEAIRLAESSSSLTSHTLIIGELISTQLIGSEILISLQAGNQKLIAKSETLYELATGSSLSVLVDLTQAHLFSAQTGDRITD